VIAALERGGKSLDRVGSVFFNLSGAHTSDAIEAIETSRALPKALESQIAISGEMPAPLVHELGHGIAGHAEGLGRVRDAEPHGLEALLADDPAGVRGIFHRHGQSYFLVLPSINRHPPIEQDSRGSQSIAFCPSVLRPAQRSPGRHD
jgi:hypothetical protein